MQNRWLAIWSNGDGEPRATMFQTNDADKFPAGIEAELVPHLDGYNDGGGLVLIEMPGASQFRPTVWDAGQDDDEIPMSFVDL